MRMPKYIVHRAEVMKDGVTVTLTDVTDSVKVSEDCLDYYKGYCSRHEDGCFHQCKDVSSVVPSRAEGEWKRHPIPENRAWDICTACGIGCRRRHYGFNEDGTEWVEQANYPYCPNCGAKMKV